MQIVLNSPGKRIAVAGAGFVIVGLFLLSGARELLADHFAASADPASLQRAIRLDPGNAEYHAALARYSSLTDRATAEAQYRAAVQLNPHNAGYWLGLAAARNILPDLKGQQQALEHAIAADSHNPNVALEAANFFAVRGDVGRAFPQFKMVIENEPSMTLDSLKSCMGVADLDRIIAQVLPPQPDAYLTLLDLLKVKKDSAGAAKVWAGLVHLGKPIEARRALQYVDYLILQQEVTQARIAWRQTAALAGLSAYLASRDNLIVNPSFSSPVLNGGFDWHYRHQENVKVVLDPLESHTGQHSLAVAFDGPAVNDAGIFQFIPVEPDTSYDFSAYYKANDIDGAGGPRLAVTDAYTGASYFLSDDLKNADVWRQTGGTLKTSAETHLLILQVLRVPRGSPIRGKLWLDDFRMVAAQP